MKSRTLNLFILACIGLTILAIGIERYLPEKRLVLLPGDDVLLVLYADGEESGQSRATWINQQEHHFVCDVHEGAAYLFCGFNLILERTPGTGLDLSGYQSLRLTMDYQGDIRHLSLYMRHYHSAYSEISDGNSSLYMAMLLRRADVRPQLDIELSEFTIADWWLSAHDIPRALARPNFSNVTVLGINFAYPGQHELQLHEIALVGEWISTEHWYLGILWLWLIAALLLTLNRLAYLHRRTLRFHRRINELASLNEALRSDRNRYHQLSQIDELTGVCNRYGFNQAVSDLQQQQGTAGAALILIDVDHFKRINDRRGHDVGDRILQQIAQIILANIRTQDTLGRWGGEEFILLCPATDAGHAYLLAEKIRTLVFGHTFEPDSPLAVSASFGVAAFAPGESFEAAFKRADLALYAAKNEGRNCTVIAETNLVIDE